MASKFPQYPYRVLVVDDDPADAALVFTAIDAGPFPCEVDRARDGVEALEKLRARIRLTEHHHLVLLDINMPRKNGFQVLAEMRADPDLRHLPVVMLSTSAATRDVANAYQSGAQGYVTKPMDIDDLFDAIHGIETYWFGTVRRPVGGASALETPASRRDKPV